MFIKKDLRKIPTILDDAVDCNVYDANLSDDEIENTENNGSRENQSKKKRTKRQEPLRLLKLGRRKQEFQGTVRILCQPSSVPKLKYLEVMNLYDCDIHDLTGFGTMFETAAPNLETLNLGRNPLSNGIPDEFSKVGNSLKHLWLDDCKLKGAFPRALLHMPALESLRLPNNQITHLDIGGIDTNAQSSSQQQDGEEFEFDGNETEDITPMISLRNLKILCLDRNLLGNSNHKDVVVLKQNKNGPTQGNSTSSSDDAMDVDDAHPNVPTPAVLPSNFAEWVPNLEECFLRHNDFAQLGVTSWPKTLEVLQVSSNKLTNLDEIVGDGSSPALRHLYANGNELTSVPEGVLACHPKLERLVVNHNPPLTKLPHEVWKKLEEQTDSGESDAALQILWQPNPNLTIPDNVNVVPQIKEHDPKSHVC